MPRSALDWYLGQLAGTTPTFEGGNGGPGPVGMAPGQPYPESPRSPQDFGFDLWRGPEGYYANPNPYFAPGPGLQPLGTYRPQGQPAQGPMGPFTPTGFGLSAMPPPSAQVWGVPLMGDALRSYWSDILQEWSRQSVWDAPPSQF